MSTISISNKLALSIAQRLFSINVPAIQYDGFKDQSDRYRVRFMKGTIPSDFSTLTGPSVRSSDVLVNFLPADLTFDGSQNPVVVSSQYVTASASGTAEWFWWCTYNSSNIPTQQMIGTIGTSGTDIVLTDTNIVSGQTYRFLNLRFQMPTSFTY